MARLPKLPYRLTRSRPTQLAFGVLNHTATAADGDIYDERDVSTEEYPALVPRKPRLRPNQPIGTLSSRLGSDGAHLFWHHGTDFFYNGERVASLSVDSAERRFVCLGERIVIWPDKVFYNTETGESGALNASFFGELTMGREHDDNDQLLTVQDGDTDFTALFATGDSITVSFDSQTNKSLDGRYTVRRVKKNVLHFKEGSMPCKTASGTVTLTGGTEDAPVSTSVYATVAPQYAVNRDTMTTVDPSVDFTTMFAAGDAVLVNLAVTCILDDVTASVLYFAEGGLSEVSDAAMFNLSRAAPDLDHICVCDNRIFGCRGSEIYACKLGDPSNWNYIHAPSLSTDSWYLDTGSPSPFTACCVYGGRPHFFTEHSVTVLYGDTPAQYSTATVELYGIRAGSADSVVAVGGALFYLSRQGIVRYTSSDGAVVISDKLGAVFSSAVAGTDGRCYYICATDSVGQSSNYKYSLKSELWSKEDGRRFLSFATLPDRLFALSAYGDEIYMVLVSGGYGLYGEDVEGIGYFFAEAPPSMEVVLAPLREDRSESTALRSRWVQRLYLRMIRSSAMGVKVSVSVRFDNGVEQEVMRLGGAAAVYDAPEANLKYEEIVPIPLPNNRCDTYHIIIRAQAMAYTEVKLLGLSREHYTFR